MITLKTLWQFKVMITQQDVYNNQFHNILRFFHVLSNFFSAQVKR